MMLIYMLLRVWLFIAFSTLGIGAVVFIGWAIWSAPWHKAIEVSGYWPAVSVASFLGLGMFLMVACVVAALIRED